MQSITVFLDITKIAYFWWKNADVIRTQGVCHVIYVFPDFREGVLFAPTPLIREQPRKSPSWIGLTLDNFKTLRQEFWGRSEITCYQSFLCLVRQSAWKTLSQNKRCINKECKAKLVISKYIVVPDLSTLKSGWIDEVKRIQNWPSFFYTDIPNLLSLTQPDFIRHLESEYKQGKAYQYFSCEVVREIYVNELSKETPVCVLKYKVIPSQHINSKPYDVWGVVNKSKPNGLGGYTHSAYCTFTAGILWTCNYVTSILFCIKKLV